MAERTLPGRSRSEERVGRSEGKQTLAMVRLCEKGDFDLPPGGRRKKGRQAGRSRGRAVKSIVKGHNPNVKGCWENGDRQKQLRGGKGDRQQRKKKIRLAFVTEKFPSSKNIRKRGSQLANRKEADSKSAFSKSKKHTQTGASPTQSGGLRRRGGCSADHKEACLIP